VRQKVRTDNTNFSASFNKRPDKGTRLSKVKIDWSAVVGMDCMGVPVHSGVSQ